MNDKDFANLVESVKQAGQIKRAESRFWRPAASFGIQLWNRCRQRCCVFTSFNLLGDPVTLVCCPVERSKLCLGYLETPEIAS
jgi:hypothetical protein